MEKDRLYLINKIFNDKKVRTVWNKESEKYYASVVDVVGIISDSKNKQAYWRKLKQRLKEEGNETVTICHGFIAFSFQALLELAPIRRRVNAVCQHTYNIDDRKVPFFLCLIPRGTDALVFE